MGASAVPIPPVASAPALQWVSTFVPVGTSGNPASPIRRHMARSSSQIAVASACSRSQIALASQVAGACAAALPTLEITLDLSFRERALIDDVDGAGGRPGDRLDAHGQETNADFGLRISDWPIDLRDRAIRIPQSAIRN